MKNGPQPLRRPRIVDRDGIRYLTLSTVWLQGAMDTADPQRIVLEYLERMMGWVLIRGQPNETNPTRVLQLGLGAGSASRFCHRFAGVSSVAVELNPEVISLCREHFGLPSIPDARVVLGDALSWVTHPQNIGSADVILVDLNDGECRPSVNGADLYTGCYQSLADGGLMTVNLLGSREDIERGFAHIQESFGHASSLLLPVCRSGNYIVYAWKNVTKPTGAELALRADALRSMDCLSVAEWLPHIMSRFGV